MIKRIFCVTLFALFVFAPLPSQGATDASRNLIIDVSFLPGLIDSVDKGAFIDLIKAMEPHTGGKIHIQAYPSGRSLYNVLEGKSDCHIPTVRNPSIDEKTLPYRFTTEKIGTVSFVIYSNGNRPITAQMIAEASSKKKGAFPYAIEAPASLEKVMGFPILPSSDLVLGLQKVHKGKIDGLIWGQEEVDIALKTLRFANIHRELLDYFDDTILVAKGSRGDRADEILSDALRKLKESGELSALYEKIHRPYDPWQPADMDWKTEKTP